MSHEVVRLEWVDGELHMGLRGDDGADWVLTVRAPRITAKVVERCFHCRSADPEDWFVLDVVVAGCARPWGRMTIKRPPGGVERRWID